MGKLTDGSGGCIYISGVPGTGEHNKTFDILYLFELKLHVKIGFHRQNGDSDSSDKNNSKRNKTKKTACI